MFTPSRKTFHILIAIDGSEHALAGVRAVRDMPLPPHSQITLLAAFLPRNASNYKLYETNCRQAHDLLLDTPHLVTEEILSGIPGEVVSNYAQEHQVDLIVIGALGLRSALGIMLGGVAQQIVEYVKQPVLVMRAPYTGFHRPLLSTDGSPCSQAMLNYIKHLPLPIDQRLDVLHVLLPPPIPQSVLVAQAWPVMYETGEAMAVKEKEEIKTMMAQEEASGTQMLNETVANLRAGLVGAHPQLTIEQFLRRGDAAGEIIEHLKLYQNDLVITGSRGLSGVRGWLLGSVSRKLLHYAPCSVLVVRVDPPCSGE